MAKVCAGANETLAAMDEKRHKKPTGQYWCMLRDLEREPGPQHAQRAASTDDDPPTLGREVETADAPPPAAIETGDAPQTEPHRHARSLSLRAIDTSDFPPVTTTQEPAPPRPGANVWQVAALALLILVFVALMAGVLTAPDIAGLLAPDEPVAAEPPMEAASANAAEAPIAPDEVPEAVTAAPPEVAPAADAVAAEEPAAAAPGIEEADAAAGAGPPRLYHEPVTRGIRGQSVRFEVAVDPPGAYRSTVWYRAVPEGPWQKRDVDGGSDGTLKVVIPAGEWLGQETAEVEYFIEVGGVGGMARSGSAVKPYRFTLF